MVLSQTIDEVEVTVLDRHVSAAERQPSLPDVVLRPASGNVFEGTVEQLATAIRLGVFARGEQLPPERELAERLGVSRNTLREAIAALRDSGLVSTRRGHGGGTWVTDAAELPSSTTGASCAAARRCATR